MKVAVVRNRNKYDIVSQLGDGKGIFGFYQEFTFELPFCNHLYGTIFNIGSMYAFYKDKIEFSFCAI